MVWEVFEKSQDMDGAKQWSFFIVRRGESPNNTDRPFSSGHWFIGKDAAGDPAGMRFYEDAKRNAAAEATRLNRAGKPPRP